MQNSKTKPKIKLYQHQYDGIDFVCSRRSSVLAYDMGLGKTLISLLAFLKTALAGEVKQALIVVPAFLLPNWSAEIQHWTNLSFCVFHKKKTLTNARIILTTYETVAKKWPLLEQSIHPDYMLIVDEAHYIKNVKSKRSQAINALRPKKLLLMTGTPVANKLEDVYGILYRADRNVVGSYDDFTKRFLRVELKSYSVKNRWGYISTIDQPKVIGYKNLEWFYELTRDLMLRKTKDECLDLPKKQVIYLPYENEAVKSKYNQLIETADVEHEDFKGISATMVRLRQLLSGVGKYINDTEYLKTDKYHALESLLEQTSGKCIVWFTFKETQKHLESLLKKNHPVYMVNGDMNPDKRTAEINSWKAGEPNAILLATAQSTGTGVNLVEANTAIFYEFDYVPAINAQAEDRIYRIGQEKAVTIYYLFGKGTIEEAMVKVIQEKKHANRAIVDKMEDNDIKEIMQYTFSTGAYLWKSKT